MATLLQMQALGAGIYEVRSLTQRSSAGPWAIATKTSAYTVTDDDYVLLGNAATAPFTFTLPTAVGRTGQLYFFERINGGANAVTIAAAAGETIDGLATQPLNAQYDSMALVTDGANWFWI